VLLRKSEPCKEGEDQQTFIPRQDRYNIENFLKLIESFKY